MNNGKLQTWSNARDTWVNQGEGCIEKGTKNITEWRENNAWTIQETQKQDKNYIRRDRIRQNGKRIARAKREDKFWKVINKVTKPKEDKQWALKEGEEEIRDEKEIAEIFIQFFIQKIEDLRDNIDATQIRDPTKNLQEKVKAKRLHFTFKNNNGRMGEEDDEGNVEEKEFRTG